MNSQLPSIEKKFTAMGLKAPIFITANNGGTISLDTARSRPIDTVLSGPASGVLAATRISENYKSLITFDMGGTSTDISISRTGRPEYTHSTQIGDYPLMLPVVDVAAIGAGGGSIINICSVAGFGQSTTQEPAYAASKGAVRVLSKVIATQHAKDNIRSNAIFPGPIDTEMVHKAMSDPKILAERLSRVPLGRLGTIAEIVSGVIFLASDESSYMTGGELVIDGGATSM